MKIETEKVMKAIDKIDEEVTKAGNGPEMQAIGDMLRDAVRGDESITDAILDPGKTVKGAYEAMYKYAKENKKGGCFCVVPSKALELIGGYYGVSLSGENGKIANDCESDEPISLFDLI